MEDFQDYLAGLEDFKAAALRRLFDYIDKNYPSLEPKIKWNQPIYTMDSTFIVGFSSHKNHFSLAPEEEAMEFFRKTIEDLGYSQTKGLFRIGWNESLDLEVLGSIIEYNMEKKAGYKSFWRK